MQKPVFAYAVVAHSAAVVGVASAGDAYLVVMRLALRVPAVVFAVFVVARVGAVNGTAAAYVVRVLAAAAVATASLCLAQGASAGANAKVVLVGASRTATAELGVTAVSVVRRVVVVPVMATAVGKKGSGMAARASVSTLAE